MTAFASIVIDGVKSWLVAGEGVAPRRRLGGQRFEIMIAGERISVPVRARFNIEHEREGGEEEIQFQVK